jgi:predicted dehydrogenase
MTAPSLRWGVMGTGWIAERFVAAAKRFTRQDIAAVGSRTPAGAQQFGERFDIRRRFGSYEDLVAAPDIDVVYVATPHHGHLPCAELALEAGKHVLVEKPFTLNASQAERLADLAAVRSLFCMEALWTFFLPKFDVIAQIIDDGLLGTIHTVVADNGEWFPPGHRIFRPELAGGPMLDLGTYLVSLAVQVLGAPDGVLADGTNAATGVNAQAGVLLRHGAARSVLHTTLLSNTPAVAVVAGDAATLTTTGVF